MASSRGLKRVELHAQLYDDLDAMAKQADIDTAVFVRHLLYHAMQHGVAESTVEYYKKFPAVQGRRRGQ